jgi:hypothetical protein
MLPYVALLAVSWTLFVAGYPIATPPGSRGPAHLD